MFYHPWPGPVTITNDRGSHHPTTTRYLLSLCLTFPKSTPGQISHKPNVDGVGLPISQIIPEIQHLLASLLEFQTQHAGLEVVKLMSALSVLCFKETLHLILRVLQLASININCTGDH